MQKNTKPEALRVLLFDAVIVASFIFYFNIVILFRIFHFLILFHLLIAAGNNAAFATDTARITQFHRYVYLCTMTFLIYHFSLCILSSFVRSTVQNKYMKTLQVEWQFL